jgi:hypothetical protein
MPIPFGILNQAGGHGVVPHAARADLVAADPCEAGDGRGGTVSVRHAHRRRRVRGSPAHPGEIAHGHTQTSYGVPGCCNAIKRAYVTRSIPVQGPVTRAERMPDRNVKGFPVKA